jgi:hypothetical protein
VKIKGRIAIKAETGTGKSTWFVDALRHIVRRERGGRVWVIVPRKILRDDWSLPFGTKHQLLKKNKKLKENWEPVICTYGHFLLKLEDKTFNREKDLALFDEFHELTGEMILANQLLSKHPVIMLSATPVHVPGLENMIIKQPAIPKKNKTEIYEMEGNVVTMFQQAQLRHPDACDRTMIIVPTYSEIDKTIAGLRSTIKPDQPVLELSNRTRNTDMKEMNAALKAGKYIFVCSQIVDAGFDIKPPARLVIDSGLQIQNDKGRITRPVWSSATNAEQRAGRTGRNSDNVDGIVFRHKNAGTGARTLSYPSGSLFLHTAVANFFQVPALKQMEKMDLPKFPVFKVSQFEDGSIVPVNLRHSLRFVFLAAMSGVQPHEMPRFYRQYAYEGKELPEDYEWLQMVMRDSRNQTFELFELVESALANKPYTVYVHRSGKTSEEQWAIKYPVDNDWREHAPSIKKITRLGSLSTTAVSYKSLIEDLKKGKNNPTKMAKILKENKDKLAAVEFIEPDKPKNKNTLEKGIVEVLTRTKTFTGIVKVEIRGNACPICGGQSKHTHKKEGRARDADLTTFSPVTVKP